MLKTILNADIDINAFNDCEQAALTFACTGMRVEVEAIDALPKKG